MGAKKCNLEDFREKIALWLDAQHIRKISLIGKNRLSVLFMDNITDEFELEGCGAGDIESFLMEMKKKGIIVTIQPQIHTDERR
ncbi:MAG: hypothetical protein Q8O04_10915 [Deltaproteobacteria bacterium]|nr:hypothetical protein [Deltaproteobacteria bacterium]